MVRARPQGFGQAAQGLLPLAGGQLGPGRAQGCVGVRQIFPGKPSQQGAGAVPISGLDAQGGLAPARFGAVAAAGGGALAEPAGGGRSGG